MNARGKNGPVFIKTYSKRMRKVEPWFSPDLKKAAFSFSSTPSSDQSISEITHPKKRRVRETGSHAAKSKGMTAIKEKESDEENYMPSVSSRKKAKANAKPSVRTTAARSQTTKAKRNKQLIVFSSSENEDDALMMKNEVLPKTSADECAGAKKELDPPHLGRFVTQRKRPPAPIRTKRISVVLHRTLDSSDDFLPPFSKNKRVASRRPFYMDKHDSKNHTALKNRKRSQNRVALAEVSFNDSDDQQLPNKRPLLSSTPSLVCRQLQNLPEPSISEISSLSFDEIHQPTENNNSLHSLKNVKVCDHTAQEKTSQQIPNPFGCVSPRSHLKSLTDELKERCRTVDVTIKLKKTDGSDMVQSCSRKGEEKIASVCLESSVAATTQNSKTYGPTKAPCTESPYTCHRESATASPFKETGNFILNSPINNRTPHNAEPVVQHLSASFQLPPVSPPASAAHSQTRPPAVPKERAGAGSGTGRKVCMSGLNVSRWSKRGTGEFNGKRKKKEGRTKAVSGDYSSCGSMLSAGADTYAGESTCGWLQGTSGIGLAVTPLRMEQMNLSSILANFTPDTLTTHSWGRLKAALSLHKKKTAFPTPRRLVQSHLKSPGSRFPAENSLDLFGSPVCTPSRFTPSRMLRSTMNTPMISYDEDISDEEKVYQECQQCGPLSFSDCIPPARMKHCNKIGEGTFGEVFSTINESNKTVALKIIPVEGSQQVNGEHQKTFGEILHEIIISKELSSLNTKEFNKTDGFIGLNNLHCVRGCYPEALLKAWDKFDCQKGSENDRPDFFDDEQLFLILEFEFGGSDLENMNGKLSSIVQAKSVLHQVTAALAVAEQALCFEHRDLHWGNILVKNIKHKHNEFILNGTVHSIETRGVHVNVIDYSLSRLEIDGLTVSCDISNDEELFMGQGDYQFEIYRLMKKENNNCWSTYNPHSNVLWLHYLADKLLSMKYKSKAQSNQQRTLKSALKSFQSEILHYPSATEALMNCKLFQ
ncbi:serine/threonine-protein kinase haspin-like isoform X2 [Onychostoma macrolepis]|uniref:serine/threonine-protein kinase haspin-like isoform X2 n=1 Tax=Onychostoma macrolepis TaxID=369639 RepID=UPI0027298858|nr:serine/threonine-protein kinase haspin-like isoform X2 [Onychostoma macrolepis]